MKLVTIGLVVSEEKSFEIVEGRQRTREPAYTISSPGAFSSGELKSAEIRSVIDMITLPLQTN